MNLIEFIFSVINCSEVQCLLIVRSLACRILYFGFFSHWFRHVLAPFLNVYVSDPLFFKLKKCILDIFGGDGGGRISDFQVGISGKS